MEKYINDFGKECYRNVKEETPISSELFHEVLPAIGDDVQLALHTNLGSLTVIDRETGYGYGLRDIETGYRDENGDFWLASGGCDVRRSGSATIGEAIAWVKRHANTCNPDRKSDE